jgi:hypothetical protein
MEIIKTVKHPDGSETFTFELTLAEIMVFHDLAKKKKKVCNPAFIRSEILATLKRGMKDDKARRNAKDPKQTLGKKGKTKQAYG